MFVNVLPVISDADFLPISTALSQLADESATVPVATDTRWSFSYPAKGDVPASNQQKHLDPLCLLIE